MRAAGLREDTDINVLDVSAIDRKWNEIFGLAGRRASVTPDAAGMVDYLGPLNTPGLLLLEHQNSSWN
jgi:hypothetical protein